MIQALDLISLKLEAYQFLIKNGMNPDAYNVLNLPQCVEMEDGSAITYTYSASGTKLSETVISPEGIRVTARRYNGPFEIRLDSIMTPVGRSRLVPRDTVIHLADGYLTMADTVFHVCIADYQGNITGVYNTRTAALEQFTDYYPYGMPHATVIASTACSNRRKFGGKELVTDRGLNLYDFAARWMNAGYPTFTGWDLLSEKKPHLSGYIFCGGDPVNNIDPTGLDEYLFNENGELKDVIPNSDYDILRIVDGDGNQINESQQYEYGTIDAHPGQTARDGSSYDYYVVGGDDAAKSIFEFMANNTAVEWGWGNAYTQNNKTTNILSTVFSSDTEYGVSELLLYDVRIQDGDNNRMGITFFNFYIHSHPDNNILPSGIFDNGFIGDKQVAEMYYQRLGYNPVFKVYVPKYKAYIPFSRNSTYKDFHGYIRKYQFGIK